jgi:hypothetical protein
VSTDRAALIELAARVLTTAVDHLDPATGLVGLPGRPSKWGRRSDGLEGLARTLLLFSIVSAAAPRALEPALGKAYRRALAVGPRGSWPSADHNAQSIVEASAISLALRLAPDVLWMPLDAESRRRLEDWLRAAMLRPTSDNNWVMFPWMIAAFLESVGAGDASTASMRERGRARIGDWYAGDGWYTDGAGRTFDYYTSWAFHFYPPLDAWLDGDEKRGAAAGAAADEHARVLSAQLDQAGGPVLRGRSLIYRFGMGAAFAAAALVSPEAGTGQLGADWRAAVGYFLDRGSIDADGLLVSGWHGPFPALAQRYSGPGSPYWAFKAFVALLLPADHEFWSEGARRPERRTLTSSNGMLASNESGIAVLINHGSDHQRSHESSFYRDDPLYAHLGYSSVTVPSRTGAPGGPRFAVLRRGVPSERGVVSRTAVGDGWAASQHRPAFARRALALPILDRGVFARIGPRVRALPGALIEELTVASEGRLLMLFRLTGLAGETVQLTGWSPSVAAPERVLVAEYALGCSCAAPEESLAYGIRAHLGFTALQRLPSGAVTALGRVAPSSSLTGVVTEDGQVFAAELSLASGTADGEPHFSLIVDDGAVRVGVARGRHIGTIERGGSWQLNEAD